MTVHVRSRGIAGKGVRPALVARRAERMLAALRLERAELSILLCDDATIHDLNARWRQVDAPTDVLAFPLAERPGPEDALGDVVISVDTAGRQAAEDDRPIVDRVVFLLAHGLLHLLGHDHRTRDETRRMSALTDALVAAASGGARRREKAVENPRDPGPPRPRPTRRGFTGKSK